MRLLYSCDSLCARVQWDQSRRHSSACSTNWKGLEAGDEDEVFTTRGGGRVRDDSGDDLGPDGIRLPPPPKDIIHIRRIKARTIEPNTAASAFFILSSLLFSFL